MTTLNAVQGDVGKHTGTVGCGMAGQGTMRQPAGGAQEAVKNVTWHWGGEWDGMTARQGMGGG